MKYNPNSPFRTRKIRGANLWYVVVVERQVINSEGDDTAIEAYSKRADADRLRNALNAAWKKSC